MSHSATKWLAENLPALRRVTYEDASGKARNAFRGEGFTLAFYFCDTSNKYGTVFMTRRVMSEKTGIRMGEIERLLSAWIRGGFIAEVGEERYMERGSLTPVYALIGIPKEYKPELIQAENERLTIPQTIPWDSQKATKALQPKENTFSSDSEPEPEPDSEPQPQPGEPKSEDLEPLRLRKEGINNSEVMRLVIAKETAEMVRQSRPVTNGLIKKWESEYPTFIAQGIAQGINELDQLVKWCLDAKAIERSGRTFAGNTTTTPPKPHEPRDDAWLDAMTQVTNFVRMGETEANIMDYIYGKEPRLHERLINHYHESAQAKATKVV
jgi:hypothetical protein